MSRLKDQPLPGMPEPEAMGVHPVADLFPMLAEDELAELAEDIKQRGQLQPIVLDAEGRVLDGRNRLAACRIAGVEPTFEKYEGDDPNGYALAVNVQRRSLKPGARILLMEQARRVAVIGGDRWKFGKAQTGNDGRLSEAAVVLDWAPHFVPQVMVGGMSLRNAAEEARKLKKEAEEVAARMAALRERAPDLYELVLEGRMTLDEGEGAAEAREEKSRQDAERAEAKARAEEEAARSAAEQAQRQREQDERSAVDRGRQGIEQVLVGWPYFRDYVLGDPTSDRAKAVLASLNESQQHSVRTIREQIGA